MALTTIRFAIESGVPVQATGINSYDALMAQGTHPRGFDREKERAAVEEVIDDDEPIVGRHYAQHVSRDGQTHAKDGAIFLSTDRRLIMLTSRGTLRVRIKVESFAFESLKPGVGNTDGSLFGQTTYLSGFGGTAGQVYMLQFFTADERDEFVRDVGGALGGWHTIHRGR